MGWTAPRTYTAGETVTAAMLNTDHRDNLTFLKSGVAALTAVSAAVGPTSGTTELVLATAPAVTTDGSTVVEVVFNWYNITLTVGTDVFLVRLYDGATAGSGTQYTQYLLNVNANGGSGLLRWIGTPTAASHTYTARVVRSAGTGTASLAATSTTQAIISVTQAN